MVARTGRRVPRPSRPIAVPDGSRLAVDSAPIIYFLEDHARFAPHFAPVFAAADEGRASILISTVTIAEVLAGPISKGKDAETSRLRAALTGSPNWTVVPLDAELAEDAARLRSRYRLRLPDAIQVAAAIHGRADLFVTHDRRLRRVKELNIVGPT